MQKFTIQQFNEMFPDENSCLDFIRDTIYPDGIVCRKCERTTKHHRLTNRKAYSCQECATHVYPLAGTVFAKSRTPLKLWLYAMFLMSSTRCGISAKQMERELGVTYKTAWRMFKQIRSLLAQDDAAMGGEGVIVEADEAFIGGRSKWRNHGRPKGLGGGWVGKVPVHGFAERGTNGRKAKIAAHVMPEEPGKTFTAQVTESTHVRVLPKSSLFTD